MQKDLPVFETLPTLNAALAEQGTAVLVAPPGAGKTTAVPLALLDESWLGDRKILLLQPRRLAARTAARRMASTLGEAVGARIGYRMRFETKVSAETKIEVVTEGVFQRMILDDPELKGVGCVIFDEFHERSMDADFGLALTLDIRNALREDLRILVMSATLNGAAVAKLLGDAPIIESKGRMHPVDIVYWPRPANQSIEETMVAAIRRALIEEQGSVLAFLPGQAEIRRTANLLEARLPNNAFVAPLYGAMDIRDQDLAVQPPCKGQRKIVLATAIAETSITIDGVRIVIDSGLARLPEYEAALGISRLVTKRASQASIAQRAGRAGRTAPGIAIRLWQEAQTASLPKFEAPEITQADVAPLILDCLSWGVMGPGELMLLDQPPLAHVDEARKLLSSLEALDEGGGLTRRGREISKISLEPRLASMVLQGGDIQGRMRRAFLALVLEERGLGGGSNDLEKRFEKAWTSQAPRTVAIKNLAKKIAGLVNDDHRVNESASVGAMLCDAFPDRVAKARADRPGHFVMANGRGVMIDETDPLATDEYIVAAEIMGSAKLARATAIAKLSAAEILSRFDDRIETQTTYSYDKQNARLICRVARKLGAITLSSAPRPAEPSVEAECALLAVLRQQGLGLLTWSKSAAMLRDRLSWLHAAIGTPWPDMSESRLIESLEEWLAPYLAGQIDFSSLNEGGLRDALMGLVPPELQFEIDRLAPSHFTVPTGSKMPLSYSDDGAPPILSVRVQELFGLTKHPAVGNGSIPLVVELLSPAHRPIQRTQDLPAFWNGSWKDVRADMRGRYPRHNWPEKPEEAVPTSRAKPRK